MKTSKSKPHTKPLTAVKERLTSKQLTAMHAANRRRLPLVPVLLGLWLLGLTIFVAWMGFYYVKPAWRALQAGDFMSKAFENNWSQTYSNPLVDVANKKLILPDQKVSFTYDPALGDVRYQRLNGTSNGNVILLTNEKVIRQASARAASLVDLQDEKKSRQRAENGENYYPECQAVVSLQDRQVDNKKPLATIPFNDMTWYAYAATDKNCSEFWSYDAYGNSLGDNGLVERFAEMAKTAQPAEY